MKKRNKNKNLIFFTTIVVNFCHFKIMSIEGVILACLIFFYFRTKITALEERIGRLEGGNQQNVPQQNVQNDDFAGIP